MHPTTRWSTLTLALVVATACSKDTTAPTANVRMPNVSASFTIAAPTGIAVDSVVGMTVFAHWQDNAVDNGGYYLVLSDASDVQSTRKYQIVYGGDATSGSITAYSNEKGCYLVSVFAYGGSNTESTWSTVGPVSVGGGSCATGTVATNNGKGKGKH